MEDVLQNVVSMVKEHPEGIPLNKLYMFYNQTYRANLSYRDLNFNSMASLVASQGDLVVEGKLVFHKDHRPSQAGAEDADGASAKPTKTSKETESVLKDVVALMKEHPGGIPLKKVTTYYSQKYHKNLTLSSVGFGTISCLVEALKEDLVVRGEVVFHKSYLTGKQLQGEPTEGLRPATPESKVRYASPARHATSPERDANLHRLPLGGSTSLLDFPLMSSAASLFQPCIPAAKPAEQLTQEQLYQRILEVSYSHKLQLN